MSDAAPPDSLVRLSVMAADRRVDLGVPAHLPLAEVIPALARALGLVDTARAHGGYRLLRADGTALDPARSLRVANVADGALLALEPGLHREPGRVYDDPVEAVADAVGEQLAPWTPRDAVLAATGAAVALLLAGAALLPALDPGSALPSIAGAVTALLLLARGAVASRTGPEPSAGRLLVLAAPVLGGVAGLTATTGPPSWGWPAALAGAGVLGTGLLGLVALVDRRELSATSLTVGSALTVTGATVALTGFEAGAVLGVLVAALGIASHAVPRVALSIARLWVVSAPGEALDDSPEVCPASIRARLAVGHRARLALRAAVGVLLLGALPAVVGTGAAGIALVGVCCTGLLLGARRTHSRSDTLGLLGPPVLGLSMVAVLASAWHPQWRGVVLAGVGLAVVFALAAGWVWPHRHPRLARIGDGLEVTLLALLPPLGAVAAGLA